MRGNTNSAQHKKTTTQHTPIVLIFSPFNRAEVEQTKARIDNETGVSTGFYSTSQPYYVYEIQPIFVIDAQTETGSIHQTFQPTLLLNSTHTTEGDIIKIQDLTQTSSGALTQLVNGVNQDIVNQRYASYILIVTSLFGLTYSLIVMFKQHNTAPASTKPGTNKLLEPYKHLIIEATENIDNITSTIKVASISELAKAAETLSKPMLHIKNEAGDNLYVIEGNTKYQYTLDVVG